MDNLKDSCRMSVKTFLATMPKRTRFMAAAAALALAGATAATLP